MAEKETIEILLENAIDWITQHLYLTFGVLVVLHLGVAWWLKRRPLAVWNSEPLKVSEVCVDLCLDLEIYIYPIKSLRGSRVSSAVATKYGLKYDRTFMLLKRTPTGLQNLAVCNHYIMTQFLTSLTAPTPTTPGTLTITFISPSGPTVLPLTIPLEPRVTSLETLDIEMHHSATTAYLMPETYSAWFTTCFGFDVVLAYLGENRRDVLFEELKGSGEKITFADCAPYLLVSATSLDAVSALLNDEDGSDTDAGEERGKEKGKDRKQMDITKFRPNIVISGAASPWEEDFWSRLLIRHSTPPSQPIHLRLEHNCVRCRSINVDYATGKKAQGKEGEVLKLLQATRRVDEGMKWSPAFGRYGFWGGGKEEDARISVGDEVLVTKVNAERTKFSWKLH
ncbi:uncharacterized protein EI97DRAFT_470638 [Westerdykella ornata]|uniref:MOSC domain-containing protein n=1 Tax=Westerdykella ornata TaxID=318751 RepID=A0A6A6J7A4_WESOR|nr:uncharacterized protein EI97DRAFT_470638 [Westerdykella ornata]KAF2272114.1 hypothetical protein EI97DRAFT_470638 [Westerdykella ornata]